MSKEIFLVEEQKMNLCHRELVMEQNVLKCIGVEPILLLILKLVRVQDLQLNQVFQIFQEFHIKKKMNESVDFL